MSSPAPNPTEQFLRRKFQEYYTASTGMFYTPRKVEQREYGFLLFKEKFMVRHRAFKTIDTLLGAIRELVPKHVYYSTAYYEQPTAAMDEKGWLGADLIFDIDADHLDTPCKTRHDSWKCKSCKTEGKGTPPKLCPKCKNDRLDEETWLCDQCLLQAKEETSKLLDMLYADIGVNPGDVRIFFSGHRGYHVHVYSDKLNGLGDEERKEIVDYVLGQGMDLELQGLIESKAGGVSVVDGPHAGDLGWRGRIVSGIYDLLQENSGLSEPLKKWDREKVLEKPFWSAVKGVGFATWKDLAQRAVEKRSARIDTVVTTDVHRLIRLPGTLNGNTGLLALNVKEESLEEFDPFTDSIAFNGTQKVHVTDSPSFRLGQNSLGPFHEETVVLPEAAAILLMSKRRANPA